LRLDKEGRGKSRAFTPSLYILSLGVLLNAVETVVCPCRVAAAGLIIGCETLIYIMRC